MNHRPTAHTIPRRSEPGHVELQSSQTIVSINKDGSAPIFDFSDFGVIGDLHQIVPKLTELVKERKA